MSFLGILDGILEFFVMGLLRFARNDENSKIPSLRGVNVVNDEAIPFNDRILNEIASASLKPRNDGIRNDGDPVRLLRRSLHSLLAMTQGILEFPIEIPQSSWGITQTREF